MIKAALQYIVGLQEPATIEVENRVYSTKALTPVKKPFQSELQVSTLSSIVEYVKKNFDRGEDAYPFVVHIEGECLVSLKSKIQDEFEQRITFMRAEPNIPKEFNFDRFIDIESFIIGLQAKFVQNDQAREVLSFVGNIKEENVRNTGDDGISQVATVKTGIATVSNAIVPNPVSLAPYRTFVEIEQPESRFVLRLKDGPAAALFEADGGAWKVDAIRNIKGYFEENLKEEIADSKVIILA